jgi:hypothetical protein
MTTTTLSACTSWQVQRVTPEQVVTTRHPSAVRVQRVDGSQVVLDTPSIGADSLLGMMKGKRTAVPLADVSQVAVKQANALQTVGLVLGVVAVVVLLFSALVVASGGVQET